MFTFIPAKKIAISFLLFFGIFQSLATPILFNDPIFENYCLANFDTNNDGIVDTLEVINVQTIDVTNLGITSLLGIEHFINLKVLYAGYHNLTSLDLSANHELEWAVLSHGDLIQISVNNLHKLNTLRIDYNDLTSLDVSGNNQLVNLVCGYNQLQSINVNGCTSLTSITGRENNLVTLDTSQNPNLETLNLGFNDLVSIDLSTNPNLVSLYLFNNNLRYVNLNSGGNQILTSPAFWNNLNLYCIQVDNPTAANQGQWPYTNWGIFSTPATYSSYCEPLTYVPDDNFEQYIITNTPENGPINDWVETRHINTVTQVQTFFSGIQDFTGIEDFTALEFFSANFEPTTQLDLSQNSSLFNIELFGLNQLANFSSSGSLMPDLNSVIVQDCGVTSLEFKDFQALQELEFRDNAQLGYTLASNIPSLEKFTVENSPNTNLVFTNCLSVEDLVLKNIGLSQLDVTGFTQLESLNCSFNQIQVLNTTQNSLLNTLQCQNNNLNVLNIKNGNNSNLLTLNATNNASLSCINVDDPNAANAAQTPPYNSGWSKDSGAVYSDTCSNTTNVAFAMGPNFNICEFNCVKLKDYITVQNLNCTNYSIDYYYMNGAQIIPVSGTGFTANTTETYYATLTDNCTGFTYTDTTEVTVIPSTNPNCSGTFPRRCNQSTSRNNIELLNVTVYPNPSSGKLWISNKGSQNLNYILSDFMGNIIQSSNNFTQETHKISLKNKGLYLLKISDIMTGKSITKKIIVE